MYVSAYGIGCLSKEVTALTHCAQQVGLQPQLLASVLPSNYAHIARAVDIVVAFGRRRVALLGLTFKPGTDDLRDSSLVELAERLIGKGFDLRIYDPNFVYQDLMGSNRHFVLTMLPHIGTLLVNSLTEAMQHGQTVIVGHASSRFVDIKSHVTSDHCVIDSQSALSSSIWPGSLREPAGER